MPRYAPAVEGLRAGRARAGGHGSGASPPRGSRLRAGLLALGVLASAGVAGWALFGWSAPVATGPGPADPGAANAPAPPRTAAGLEARSGGSLVEVCRPAPGRPSLLAVGDTGVPPDGPEWPVQLRVGEGLAAVDRRAPADALVLLGDNFYPSGLRAAELAWRARENLLRPYGFFAGAGAARAGAAGEAADPASARPGRGPGGAPPRPIYAVLGNHDWKSPESPHLQRTALPELVPGWQPPPETVDTREVGRGLSLVLFDSRWLARTGAVEALAGALRAARGPFVVLASHVPSSLDRRPEGLRDWDLRYAGYVEQAVRRAGRVVQLRLAGHEHNLQVIELVSPAGGIEVIAGSGARPKAVRQVHLGRLFASPRPGFARAVVTAGPRPGAERLVVELYEVRGAGRRSARVALAARFRVDRAGHLRAWASLPCPAMEPGLAGAGAG